MVEIKSMYANTRNVLNTLIKEILILKKENTNMKAITNGKQKQNNENLITNVRNDLEYRVKK